MSYNIPHDNHSSGSTLGQAQAQHGLNKISLADPLDSLENTFRELAGRIASCRQRLVVKVDRMIGSRPEAGLSGPQSEPSCLLEWTQILRQEVELLEGQLDRIS